MNSLREFIISWNNKFPLDRIYRKKYNIPFGSSQHLQTNQIDIYLEFLEENIYQEHYESLRLINDDLEVYKKTGKFLKDMDIDEERANEFFENLDLSAFDNKEEET